MAPAVSVDVLPNTGLAHGIADLIYSLIDSPKAGFPRLRQQTTPRQQLQNQEHEPAAGVQVIAQGGRIQTRALTVQQKTGRPVQLEITDQTRQSLENWIAEQGLRPPDYLFQSRVHKSSQLSRRQYARIVNRRVSEIGLDPALYGTHSMRRTKASLIYRRTKNIRAVQLLLGHTKLESTVRYLGIDVDDALELSEQKEV